MEQENFEPLTFDEILEDKEYQREFDRRVQKAINTAKSKWANEQIGNQDVASSEAYKTLQDELASLKQTIAMKDAKEKDMEVTYGIEEALKDKQFVNDYTKNAIVNEIKNGLYTRENVTIDSLFDELTKDKTGILVNPNQADDIPTPNADIYQGLDKQAFAKMGYKERVALKEENPELFEQLNNQ